MRARLVIALAVGIGLLAGPGAGVAAAAPCDAPVNPIACENSKPGTPASTWDISGAGSASIQGFATDISVNVGSTVQFKVNTSANAYRLDIYRLGYYGGDGARLQGTVHVTSPQDQPACLADSSTGLVDCGNWAVSASWAVPADAVSGIYLAHLVREDGTSGESHIAFVVRNDASHAPVLFQTSDTTWQAYNQYGGNSLYVGSPGVAGTNPPRAYKVSYNRPFTTRESGSQDWLFNAEYPMVRWLERNGYDVSYMSGLDSDRIGGLIKNHRTFLSVGHDEYWSGGQRANVEAARDAGTNLAFFSGNEVFWKTRWEPSIDGSGTPNRTLVCYKDTHAGFKIDASPGIWTGTWRDPLGGAYDAGRPENSLTGQLFRVNYGTTAITVPAAYGKWPLWRNTDIATLPADAVTTLAAGTLGYEWDENFNGSQPANSIDLSATTLDGAQILLDAGSTYGDGSATHHLNLYRAASGALVFGAGTVQWSWGLDTSHDGDGGATDVRMQQATANLLTDMGAQASTLQSGLVAPTPTNPMLPTGSTPPPPPPPPPSSPDPNAPRGEPSAKPAKPSGGAGGSSTGTGAGSAATGQGSTVSNAGCLKLTSAVKRLRTGRRTVLRATVRKSGGRPAAGVRVVLSGNGKSIVRRSDRRGRVSFAVRPRHAGTLRLRGPSQLSSCKAAVVSIRVR
jgi:hypothetical protein